ncbi:MAG: putative ABC transporter permease [Bacilli bacterium]|nr:putative ABC transporter permease [Bacilli bacterium]
MYYINSFFIYSVFGYIFEIIVNLLQKHKPISGILYGPWTPIYGIGAVLILIIFKKVFKVLKLNKFLEILIALLIIALVLTFIEWIGGILIEKFFHITFWDYRKLKLNIGKYIALEVTGIWIVGSLVILYFLQPLFNKFIKLIPNYFTYLLIILMVVDMLFTIFTKKVK